MSATTMGTIGSRSRRALAAALLASTALAGLPATPILAQDATWLATPGSGDMTDGANWTGGTVPTGAASFGTSTITSLTTASALYGGWSFAAGAPAYTIATSGIVSFVGAGISVGGAAPTINNTGTIEFFNASSAGSATIANTGTLSFYNWSSAGSGTISNASTMRFFDASTAGLATVSNSGDIEFYGASSAGSATFSNTNVMWFFNSSSAGSATISNPGIVLFQHNSSAGSATIDNTGQIDFNAASSAGSSNIANTGLIRFSDNSSAGSATISNSSTLRFSDNSSAGSAAITNNAGLEFEQNASAGASTIVNNGIVRFSSFGTAGSAIVTSNGNWQFEGSSTAGSAAMTNHGTMIFRGSASAGTSTIVNNGQLNFRDSSSAATSSIVNNSQLNFQGHSSTGASAITNNGDMSFSFLGNAGSAAIINNGFMFFQGLGSTGNATITGAGEIVLLSIDTTGSATVTLQSGGLLRGFGAIGNTTVQSGATFQPNFNGTLTVNGNLSLAGGAIYDFLPGNLTAITGMASLGGATLQFRPASFQAQTYTVLTAAGGVTGTFTFDPALASVLYGANDVTLTVNGYRAGGALTGSGRINSRNVAGALDRVIDASGGAPPSALNPLINLYGPLLANALTSLTGEAATSAQSTSLSTVSTFLGIMLDPMAGARGAAASAPGSSLIEMADTGLTPAARVAAGWSVWTKAFGQAGRSASDAGTGAAGTATTVFGVAAGADRIVSPGTLVGFALAGGGTAFGLGQRGSGIGEYMQLGFYGSTKLGEGYLSAAIAYGWNRFDVSRRAGLGPLETYTSSPLAHTFGSRIEAGRRFGSRALAVTPYAAVEAIGYASGAYRESWVAPATGAFALAYGARTTGTVRTELGLRIDGMRAIAPTADLLTFGRIAYGFQANTARAADAAFQQLVNSGFTVFGGRASTHTMLATLGTEIRLAAGTRATASVDGELGDRHRSIRANVGLSHSW